MLIPMFHLGMLALLAAYGVLAASRPELGSVAYWLFWLTYVALLLGAVRKVKWCLRLSVLPPLLIFLTTAPSVLYNAWAFLVRHPLYQDSPATIFVVGVVALFLTIPSLLVLAAYWRRRKQIFGAT